MRSLTQQHDDERGAVVVWVALMLTVLIGVGALVIDAGAFYTEKRELQNGADAAALAVAADCANGACNLGAGRAADYANKNANDGTSTVTAVCGSGPGLPPCAAAGTGAAAGWVKVTTTTRNPDSSSEVNFLLAPLLGADDSRAATASAVAAWGTIGAATTIPLTLSVCEFGQLGGALDGSSLPIGPVTIKFHGEALNTCNFSSAGQNLPGGFGWLTSTGCVADVEVGEPIGSKPGASIPSGCDPQQWIDAPAAVVPIYSECVRDSNGKCSGGTGSVGGGGGYDIVAFAGVEVLGFKKQGNSANSMWGAATGCAANETCLRIEFTRVTTNAGEFGGAADYGATTIAMIA